MTVEEILTIIQQNPGMQLATADKNGHPHTRGMMMYSADPSGIIFHTAVYKDLYKQLKHQSAVEVSFLEKEKFIQIRVRGVAEELNDQALKEKIVNTPGREFLKPWVAKMGYEPFVVFKIKDCIATVFTMDTNFDYPKPEISF